MSAPVKAGDVIEFPYPFVRELYDDGDPEGGPRPCWRPGVRFDCQTVQVGDGEFDEHTWSVADGTGKQVVTVVSIHKPGKFPTRVFFTRRWIGPDGVGFGKGKLHIKSLSSFRELVRGYRHTVDKLNTDASTTHVDAASDQPRTGN